jgi:hypothetical protein
LNLFICLKVLKITLFLFDKSVFSSRKIEGFVFIVQKPLNAQDFCIDVTGNKN